MVILEGRYVGVHYTALSILGRRFIMQTFKTSKFIMQKTAEEENLFLLLSANDVYLSFFSVNMICVLYPEYLSVQCFAPSNCPING